jgi:hypothetical protein
MLLRRLVAAAVFALCLGAGADARAEPTQVDLEKAHNAYVAKNYAEAEERLRTLVDPRLGLRDSDQLAEARMYLAATLLAEDKKHEAKDIFDQLLMDRPDYQGDPLRVSLEAIDALTDAKARNREKIAQIQAERVRKAQEERAHTEAEKQRQAARLLLLEKLAGEEHVIEKNSRFIALLPFGVGQFQNGQTTAGWMFLGTQALFGAGAIVSALASSYEYSQAKDLNSKNQVLQATAAYNNSVTWAIINYSLLGAFGLDAVLGIVHAQTTFVPQREETRKRAIPMLSLTPMVAPVVGGASVGVGGAF